MNIFQQFFCRKFSIRVKSCEEEDLLVDGSVEFDRSDAQLEFARKLADFAHERAKRKLEGEVGNSNPSN